MEERRIIEELTIVHLLAKLVRREELTALEQKTVEIWATQNRSNQDLFNQLQDENQTSENLVNFGIADYSTESSLDKLHTMLDKRRSAYNWKRWLTAAAVIAAVSISILIYLNFRIENTKHAVTANTAGQDILPGKDQASLTFEDGKTIELKGEPIKTDINGTSYADGTSIAKTTVQYATLSTPRKGQYKMTLPDGTKVWLNAESALKYPTQFTGNERVVELQGEGYFEVAHNAKKPFIVNARHQKLKVLGTKFNINSYENETAIQTTLVSGKVELTNSQNNTPVVLEPGQQGELFSLSSIFFVNNVDTETFTAWMENLEKMTTSIWGNRSPDSVSK